MARASFALSRLVVAAQVIVPVAAAARGAAVLVQGRGMAGGGLVVLASIVSRGSIGHIMRAVGFLVHEEVSF
jgi:hypothetical protein